MVIKKLRMRLTAIFTFSTGIILLFIVFFALITNQAQYKRNSQENFENVRSSIIYKLQAEPTITQSYLSLTEVKGNYIIHIEDNGSPFYFKGSWNTPTDRETLINSVCDLALKDDINIKKYPTKFELTTSNIFTIYGQNGEKYYGSVSVQPMPNGWKSLVLLKYVPYEDKYLMNQKILYLTIGLIGILGLFIISWIIVGLALKPVEESRKRQNQFIASASHELRSPLAVVRASASAIISDKHSAEKFASTIDKECNRMSLLIDDMLLLASADSNTWTVNKTDVDMDTVILELFEKFELICNNKKQTIDIQLPDKPIPIIYADRNRISQMLSIFIDNASSYTPEGGKICIKAEVNKNMLYIYVIDNGVGITENEKQFIFNRFYRADKSRSDKKHFGLGLSIASELVKLHNGSISVADTPDGGATFIIKIPIN